MEKIKFPILITTVFLMVYVTLPVMGVDFRLILSMFSISPIIVIWMVYNVLVHGKHSGKKFENYWYEHR